MIDPDEGPAQTVQLAPSPGGDPLRASTATLLVMPKDYSWTCQLDVLQGVGGSRYVRWPNVAWDAGAVPALAQAPGATTSVTLWSSGDGVVRGRSTASGYPGVDPTSVPGVDGSWEAWSQPATRSVDRFVARTGRDMVGAPGSLEGVATTARDLPIWQRGLVGLKLEAGAQMSVPVRTTPGRGWTLVVSFRAAQPSSDVALVSMSSGAEADGVALQATTSTPYVSVDIDRFSNYHSLYQQVYDRPVVATLLQPAGGAPGVLRWNGHAVAGASPWVKDTAMSVLTINGLSSGPVDSSGQTLYGVVTFASQELPAASPSDVVPLLERWAAATLALAL